MLGFCSSFQEVKEYYFYFQGQEFVKGATRHARRDLGGGLAGMAAGPRL